LVMAITRDILDALHCTPKCKRTGREMLKK